MRSFFKLTRLADIEPWKLGNHLKPCCVEKDFTDNKRVRWLIPPSPLSLSLSLSLSLLFKCHCFLLLLLFFLLLFFKWNASFFHDFSSFFSIFFALLLPLRFSVFVSLFCPPPPPPPATRFFLFLILLFLCHLFLLTNTHTRLRHSISHTYGLDIQDNLLVHLQLRTIHLREEFQNIWKHLCAHVSVQIKICIYVQGWARDQNVPFVFLYWMIKSIEKKKRK